MWNDFFLERNEVLPLDGGCRTPESFREREFIAILSGEMNFFPTPQP